MSCLECGKPVVTMRNGGRPRVFCIACRPQKQTLYLPRPLTRKVCSVCTRKFSTTRSNKKTCSDECSKARSRNYSRKYWYVNSPHVERVDKACENPRCRKKFKVGLKTRFCSEVCRMSRRNQLRPGASLRHRIAKFGSMYEPVDRMVVFDRDKWMCGLCGERCIKSKLGKRHPKAPTIDHVTPLSKGGSHTYGNVQCAHLSCNMSKRDSV